MQIIRTYRPQLVSAARAKAHVERPSKVTVPAKANPLARLVFQLMKDNNVTYDELEWRSGVLKQTFKAWRVDNRPGLASIEAALGSFGWSLVPCPPLSKLRPSTLELIEEAGQDFVSDQEALAAIMATVCKIPVRLPERSERAPLVKYRNADRPTVGPISPDQNLTPKKMETEK